MNFTDSIYYTNDPLIWPFQSLRINFRIKKLVAISLSNLVISPALDAAFEAVYSCIQLPLSHVFPSLTPYRLSVTLAPQTSNKKLTAYFGRNWCVSHVLSLNDDGIRLRMTRC